MRRNVSPEVEAEQRALHTLFRAIASRDPAKASAQLAQSPLLARLALAAGATRKESSHHFFPEIAHYAYAGDTALHIAAAAYARDIAATLVSKGANMRASNRRGAEPLHYAADGIPGSKTWDPDAQYAVIDLLIRAGAEPNARDKNGVAPLHRAVRTRGAAAVRALLTHGANVRGRNEGGSTPLHLAVQDTGRGGSGSAAAREQQAQIIRILLDHGARPSDKDSAGRSARDCAKAEWIRTLLGAA